MFGFYASQHGMDTPHQLGGREWLDEVVVHAQVLLDEYRPLLDQGYTFDTLAGLVLGLKGAGKEGSEP